MAIRLIADENFRNETLRGLFQQKPEIDIIRVQDVGLTNTEDPLILAWAPQDQRILITHDANTMTKFAYDLVRATLPMPGLLKSASVFQLELLSKKF